jgi:hypothetical protein
MMKIKTNTHAEIKLTHAEIKLTHAEIFLKKLKTLRKHK